jgi:hypothetical protein
LISVVGNCATTKKPAKFARSAFVAINEVSTSITLLFNERYVQGVNVIAQVFQLKLVTQVLAIVILPLPNVRFIQVQATAFAQVFL